MGQGGSVHCGMLGTLLLADVLSPFDPDSASYTCSLFYPGRHSSNLENVLPKMRRS